MVVVVVMVEIVGFVECIDVTAWLDSVSLYVWLLNESVKKRKTKGKEPKNKWYGLFMHACIGCVRVAFH